MIIRGDRIHAASCVLPLTERKNIGKNLGTRHKAGVGLSEVSDAFIIIVSEETGVLSTVKDGKIRRYVDIKAIKKDLLDIFLPSGKNKPFYSAMTGFIGRGGNKSGK